MAKVLFITKGGEYFPPCGIMQISATAKQRGHQTTVAVISREDVAARVERDRPDVVAYSGSTGEHQLYFKFNRELKDRFPDLVSIMGGPHATFFPERTLLDAKLTAVCIGEGDLAFPEFLNRVDRGRDFAGLDNIMVDPNVRPALKPLVQDLDSLPFPDRDLFYEYGESGNNPIKHFFATRGCPFTCTYCFNDQFKAMYHGQKYIRRRSVENILAEIRQIRQRWPLKYLKFYDDVFTLRADEWLEEFADKYSRQVGLPFFCLTRADVMTEDMARLLQRAGCRAISMSIECANPEVRKNVLHRHMSNEQIKRGYKLCGEHGIRIVSNNILALPTSILADDIATVDFNIECGAKQGVVVIGEFGTAHPYPGTQLEKFCRDKGFYDEAQGFADMHMSYHDESPLNCFSPEVKRKQANLALLGLVAVRFPRLRNLIVNHLIGWPQNPLFFMMFYLAKTTGYMKHIYPIGYTPRDYLRVIPQSLKLDWFKRMGGRKWKHQT